MRVAVLQHTRQGFCDIIHTFAVLCNMLCRIYTVTLMCLCVLKVCDFETTTVISNASLAINTLGFPSLVPKATTNAKLQSASAVELLSVSCTCTFCYGALSNRITPAKAVLTV